MTGTKTNERPGVRAYLNGARFSAYKAREVLNLIRGKSVAEARGILLLTERGCSVEIGKLLDSAVANAGNNNDIPPEELFISACFADEGPTMRRFRPRARGRGARIRKRTCSVTIIVARMNAADLERSRTKNAGRRVAPADAAGSRARRVARSRKSGETTDAVDTTEVEAVETDVVESDAIDTEATDTEVVDTDAVESEAVEADSAEDTETDVVDAAADADEQDETIDNEKDA